MLKHIIPALAAALVCHGAGVVRADTVVYRDTIDGPQLAPGVGWSFNGVGTIADAGPLTGLGPVGNQFGTRVWWNQTGGGGSASPTRYTLTNLPTHTSLSVGFLLAIIDSWDGSSSGAPYQPDYFNVKIDDVSVFSETFDNYLSDGSTQSYVAPTGGVLLSPLNAQNVAGTSVFVDSAYDMYLESRLQNIAHTSSSVTIELFASGAGWQGGGDESWAIDNLELSLKNDLAVAPVPLPAAAWGGIALFGLIGAKRLRRKHADA